ncbi:MAG: 4a-hydroxytetrahydrobiopterin dehydratase [Burkholderiales bacterium]|nr:4a-hydroxytetrahydrobiopterin dehydratase [Burkholderiales bacterium]
MSNLAARRCKPSVTKLAQSDATRLLGELPGWQLEGDTLVKTFPFKNYHETMAFVNAIAWIAHREDHHPDLSVGYNKCRVEYSTHSVGGLSENDFICAAKIEAALAV